MPSARDALSPLDSPTHMFDTFELLPLREPPVVCVCRLLESNRRPVHYKGTMRAGAGEPVGEGGRADPQGDERSKCAASCGQITWARDPAILASSSPAFVTSARRGSAVPADRTASGAAEQEGQTRRWFACRGLPVPRRESARPVMAYRYPGRWWPRGPRSGLHSGAFHCSGHRLAPNSARQRMVMWPPRALRGRAVAGLPADVDQAWPPRVMQAALLGDDRQMNLYHGRIQTRCLTWPEDPRGAKVTNAGRLASSAAASGLSSWPAKAAGRTKRHDLRNGASVDQDRRRRVSPLGCDHVVTVLQRPGRDRAAQMARLSGWPARAARRRSMSRRCARWSPIGAGPTPGGW